MKLRNNYMIKVIPLHKTGSPKLSVDSNSDGIFEVLDIFGVYSEGVDAGKSVKTIII